MAKQEISYSPRRNSVSKNLEIREAVCKNKFASESGGLSTPLSLAF